MGKKKQKKPLISVMMCAHNAAEYIREAIDSILVQTFKDFELIIVDDKSTDKTLDIIKSYDDLRIRIFECPHDYIKSLNTGMKHCRGEFIARMDADDKMMPKRLEKQLGIMRQYPEMTVCFSWAYTFGHREGLFGYGAKEWVENALFGLLTGNFLTHPSAMFRKSFFKQHRIRYKNYPYAEDYKLWADIARLGGKFYVIPEPLISYRISPTQVSHTHHEEQNKTRLLIQQEIIEELLPRLKHPHKRNLSKLYGQALILNQSGLIQGNEVIVLMYRLLQRTIFFNEDKCF